MHAIVRYCTTLTTATVIVGALVWTAVGIGNDAVASRDLGPTRIISPAAPCETAMQRCTWQLTMGGELQDKAYAVAGADEQGIFVAGHTRSFGDPRYDGLVVRLARDGDVLWRRVLGGSGSDQIYGVVAMDDGGAVVAGHTGSRGTKKADAWIVRLDQSGETKWVRTLGGAEDDRFRALAAMPDGGFVAGGFTRSFGVGEDDAWVVRFDAAGEEIWRRTFGGHRNDGAFDIAVDKTGRITVAGYSRSNEEESYTAWLFRLSGAGDMLWQRHFDVGRFDSASAVTATADGGILVLGIAGGDRFAQEDSWAARFDVNGEMLWRRTFEGTYRDTGWSAITTSDDGFIIALASNSRGAGSADTWLLRLSPDGEKLWERVYGGELWDRPAAVTIMPDGAIVVAGYTTTSGAGYEDYWVLRLDRDGRM